MQHKTLIILNDLQDIANKGKALFRTLLYTLSNIFSLLDSKLGSRELATEPQGHKPQNLTRILDNLFCCVCLLDTQGIIQEINNAPLQQSGTRREDVIGLHLCECPWWIDDEAARHHLSSAIEAAKQGKTTCYDIMVNMGEKLIPVDLQISPVRDENGQIVGLLPIWIDISARKQAEQLSRRHKVLLNTTHDGFWLVDRMGYLLETNQAYANMSGYSIEELTGMHIEKLEAWENGTKMNARIDKIISQGFDVFESCHRCKNGTLIDVEISVNYIAESQQFFAFFRDITERHKTQLHLARLASRQHAIVDGANYSIIATDCKGLITDFNAAAERMLGYRAEELIGKQTPTIIHDQSEIVSHAEALSVELGLSVPPGFDAFVTKARLMGVEEREWTYIRKDGTRFPVLLSVTSMYNEKKQIVGYMGIANDISEHKKAEEALHIAATTFETQEAIMITDADGKILRVNKAFENITGYNEQEVIGKNPRILSSGRHDKAFYAELWQTLKNTGSWNGEMWDRHKSGDIYPKHLTITAVKSVDGLTTQYVAMFTNISERKKSEEEIYNLAFYDPLTGLPNRRLLFDRLAVAISASGRSQQYGALLFLDMDNFKILNDTMGHDVGDGLLIQVAERLRLCVRESDTVGRLGGDEFLILMENISDETESASLIVAQVAEKIRKALSAPYLIKNNTHHSSPSIGVRLFYKNETSIEVLLKHADVAMYQAKDSGRNKVRFFDPELQRSVETRAALESDLRLAITEQQLCLHYQIQLDQDLRHIGAEALVRWIHPQWGVVSPAMFIPVAEESSLILDIGNWVLDSACQQLGQWSHNPLTRHLVLAVNISAKQFMQTDFVDQVAATIKRRGAPPSRLKLELTESIVLDDVDAVIVKMNALKQLHGVTLSLDDFGTGYSSLSYLKRLPIHQIKIDQSFVRDMMTDSNDAIMVKTIIDLAKNFELHVIAEGVETHQHLAFLMQYGCDAFQGYLFSEPLPLQEFEALMTKPH